MFDFINLFAFFFFSQKVDSSGSFPGKEELELSLQKLEKDLKEMCTERDKALQELARLKQSLLEMVGDTWNFMEFLVKCFPYTSSSFTYNGICQIV